MGYWWEDLSGYSGKKRQVEQFNNQVKAMQEAQEQTQQGLQDILDMLKPELEARQQAVQQYQDILSGKTDITKMAGYQQGLETGTRALESSGAARGMQLSGNMLENLGAFGTQYYQQMRNQALGEVGGLAGITAPALQYGTGVMGDIASLPMQQYQMQLAAQQGQAASQAGLLGGIGSLLLGIGSL